MRVQNIMAEEKNTTQTIVLTEHTYINVVYFSRIKEEELQREYGIT